VRVHQGQKFIVQLQHNTETLLYSTEVVQMDKMFETVAQVSLIKNGQDTHSHLLKVENSE
jgi:hypothetical protein